ncbi:hypothetical protein D3C81_2188110 [compost metagenome]
MNNFFELLQILKALKLREIEKSTGNRKMSALDKKYLDLIRNTLTDEISLALEMPREKAEVEIMEKLGAGALDC